MPEWRTILEFPDYEVSDEGQVRRSVAAKTSKAGKIMTLRPHSKGYLSVNLRKDGLPHCKTVHRLVAKAFLGPAPTPNHIVAHFNGIGSDNRVGNIRWATYAENESDKLRHGTRGFGEQSSRHKLTEADVHQIDRWYIEGKTGTEIASLLKVSPALITLVLDRAIWSHIPKIEHERRPGGKLCERDIHEIDKMMAQGMPVNEVAAKKGISIGAVSLIAARKRWSHVPKKRVK